MIFYFVVGKPKSLGKKKDENGPTDESNFQSFAQGTQNQLQRNYIFLKQNKKKVILTMYPKAKHLKLHKQTNKKFIVILDENKKEKKNDLAETNQS